MENQFYVYLLKCNNGAYYVGHTDNIDQRLSQHHLGSVSHCYTKSRRPLELMYVQVFATRDEAFHAERQIKGWSRKKKEALIESNWEEIKRLNSAQKDKSARRHPSTSSGRAQRSPEFVFTAELVEALGRAQRSPEFVFTAEPLQASDKQINAVISHINAENKYIILANEHQHYSFVFDSQTSYADEIILRFELQQDSQLKVHILIMHTSLRITIECILLGKNAHADIRGAYILSGESTVAIDTVQYHQACHTNSTLIMKGALYDKAQVQYQGNIHIEQSAQKSYASQENKNIILSPHARAISIPNLEVLANDVKCFHASAVGRFDEEQLFYTATRGIDEKSAERILLQAFFADVINDNESAICYE